MSEDKSFWNHFFLSFRLKKFENHCSKHKNFYKALKGTLRIDAS